MSDELKIRIEGVEYPWVDADSLDLDETIILFDYSSLTLDQLDDHAGFNPRVIKAFVHIAVRRKEPQRSESDIRELVGQLKLTQLQEAFESVEDDAVPPTQGPSSENETGGGSSGPNGSATGGPSLEPSSLVSTGAPRSDIGAPSNPRILAD